MEERDVEALLTFYDLGAEDGGFELGIRTGLEAILASPHFIFRIEDEPSDARPGRNYRLDDSDLATRLSFFLWGAPPDDELARLAAEGRLRNDRVLEEQARRMLADPRSEALGERFAAQRLRLQDLDKVHPDAYWFPNFDQQLAEAMREETVTFFNHLVREDLGLLELYDADYTFVNERLARHYEIPEVVGEEFQRVSYPDETRRGLLGQGSVLVNYPESCCGTEARPLLCCHMSPSGDGYLRVARPAITVADYLQAKRESSHHLPSWSRNLGSMRATKR